MRRRFISPTSAFAVTLLVAGRALSAVAQEPSRPSIDSTTGGQRILTLRTPTMYGAWVAAARHSAFRTRTGVPGHRDFYVSSIRLGWALGGGDDPARLVNGSYFIDLIPAAVSTSMPEYLWSSRCQPGTFCPGATPILHDAYAIGLAPLGWAMRLGRGPARLTMEASGGGLWFSRRIPDPEATRFNFTASAGPAVEWRWSAGPMLRVGYLWHHTSNAGTGRVNPGMNSAMLTLGLLWRR